MNAGQLQSLKDLFEFLKQQEVGEFELEQEDLKVRLSFAGHGGSAANVEAAGTAHFQQPGSKPASSPTAGATEAPSHLSHENAAASVPSAAGEEATLHIVK